MMFCVLLVCVLNRDFGCMLTIEKQQKGLSIQNERARHSDDDEDILLLKDDRSSTNDESGNDPLFEGNSVSCFTCVLISHIDMYMYMCQCIHAEILQYNVLIVHVHVAYN